MSLFRRRSQSKAKKTKLQRSSLRRQLSAESLEQRRLLAGDFVINELRISHVSADNDSNNFVEIYETSGTPSDSTAGLHILAVSGEFAPGAIDFAIDISSGTTDGGGFLLVADDGSAASLDPGDVIVTGATPASGNGLDFFGSPVTFLLVDGFTGAQGDDLDTDDDGVFDTMPWTSIVDSVSITNAAGDGFAYSANVVNNVDNFTPAAVARIPDGTGAFGLQRAPNDANDNAFFDDSGDTPGFTNEPSFEIVESGGATGVVEGTGNDTFTVALTTAPADDVVVDLTFGGQIDASPTQLTFTPMDFAAKTVTVTANVDAVVEGLHSDAVSFTVSSLDMAFDGAFIPSISVTVSDPAVASTDVVINEARISHSTFDDDSNNFVELYDTNGTSGVDLTGLTLVVLTDNFNGTPDGAIGRVVALDGGSTDADGFTLIHDDGSDAGIIKDAGDISVTDLDFGGIPTTFLLVTGFTGAEGQDLDTDDDGTLDTTPWVTIFDGVTLDSSTGNAGSGLGLPKVNSPDEFAAAGGRRITDGTGSYSLLRFNDDGQDTPGFTNELAPGVRIIDSTLDPADGISADLDVAEARTVDFSSNVATVMETFSVVLDAAPATNVTVTIDPDTQLELFGNAAGAATNLTFTPGNWYLPQMVTVTAADDAVDEGDHTGTITITPSGDASYAALSVPDLTADIVDNDNANHAVVINEVLYDPGTMNDSNLDTIFSSVDDEFVEILNTGSSNIDLSGWTISGDQGAVHTFPSGTVLAAGQAYVIFGGGTIGPFGTYMDSSESIAQAAAASTGTLGLANGGETVTLSDGVRIIDQLTYVEDELINDDALARGPNGTGPFASSKDFVNLNFEPSTPGRDNEGDFTTEFENGKAILTIQSGAALTVNEEGETSDTFDVVLSAQPSGTVTVNVSVSDGETTVGPSSLTFTTGNWQTPQTVTVTAVDDGDLEGAHTGAISLSASGADATYNATTNPDVLVNVIDNEGAGASVVLNEVFVNPGGSDDAREYIEILSTTGGAEALTGLWLIEVEGDGTGAGVIDNAQDLSSLSTGTNGLLLLGDGYGTTGTPWPAGTVDAATALADLDNVTMENGSITFLLVTGFSGAVGGDIDTDNDGIIDNPLWATVIDSVGWTDGGGTDQTYTPATLSQVTGTPDAASRILGDTTADSAAAWYNGDIDNATTPDDFATLYVTGDNASANLPPGGQITPGSSNTPGTPTGGTVVDEHLFYNDSFYDGDDPMANAADDAAIDTSKSSLRTGTATFANYSGFDEGINGIMIDIAGLPATPVADDFEFTVGNDDAPDGWSLLGVTPTISVRAGEGTSGSDRVTLIFPNDSITNTWLEITVLATGPGSIVDTTDVFYFGNILGEVGVGSTTVNSTDFGSVSASFTPIFPPGTIEPVTAPQDVNKDGKVNSTDAGFISANFTPIFPPGQEVKLITPGGAAVGPIAAGAYDDDASSYEIAVDEAFSELAEAGLF
tara:strand:+ start:61123 stop:65544 length:4422 start_codon:yes stop_codon:yes gene_type:complete